MLTHDVEPFGQSWAVVTKRDGALIIRSVFAHRGAADEHRTKQTAS